MDERVPPQLRHVLNGEDPQTRDDAWRSLLAQHTRLLMESARSVTSEHDGVMDAYAYMLERLRSDDFRPLRQFVADGKVKFSTWLTSVSRHMCVDFYRKRYGRARIGEQSHSSVEARREARRRLADLSAAGVDVVTLPASDGADAEEELRLKELNATLAMVLRDLEPRDRLLLKLRFEDGLKLREIASVLDWPTPFHAHRRLDALFDDLRRRLLAKGVDDSKP